MCNKLYIIILLLVSCLVLGSCGVSRKSYVKQRSKMRSSVPKSTNSKGKTSTKPASDYAKSSVEKGSSSKKSSTKTSIESNSIVELASQQIGNPYRYSGDRPGGFDCSGLVYYIYKKEGMDLPRVSSDQARIGKKIPLKSCKMGDLIFFGTGSRVKHVGIVSGSADGWPKMIHASSSHGVIETRLADSDYWRQRLLYARRLYTEP